MIVELLVAFRRKTKYKNNLTFESEHFAVLIFQYYHDFKILVCHHLEFKDIPTLTYLLTEKRAQCLQNPIEKQIQKLLRVFFNSWFDTISAMIIMYH